VNTPSRQAAPASTSVVEQAARFVQCAITVFENDREAARGYLGVAASLLTSDADTDREAGKKACRPSSLTAWRAKRIMDYIESHLDSKMDVDELAGLLALSRSYFARCFRERLGIPPMTFVAIRRVERAKALMRSTHEPLTAIALACGFGDQPHLTRWFRRVVGTTPGRYRRAVQNEGVGAIVAA
jgi:AraC-like DNA-binding protein